MRRYIHWFFVGCLLLMLPLWTQAQTGSAVSRVVRSARGQVGVTKFYDPAYTSLKYPGGDVALEKGVCTDVVVRSFRAGGVDLQKVVHEDMKGSFGAYPKLWGLKRADSNIDHRRVANLQVFFQRKGKTLPVSTKAEGYLPGDVVAWRLTNGRLHIGVVSDRMVAGTKRRLVVHNIGAGAQEEDVLFAWTVLGHYRYFTR